MVIYFAYPSYSDYFIGRGDDILIITDTATMKIVTVHGDKDLGLERLILLLFDKCLVRQSLSIKIPKPILKPLSIRHLARIPTVAILITILL